ncbi:Protein irg-7 [Labeo rohita]|uniref:Protein irg-7 n=1 Tax=Labeo rohita TaxID=84645 RepID=A0ABQ8MYF8_LABRO|nr:Protein irg-7 [Labeo rohita]
MYQIGILQGFRCLSKNQQKIVRNLQVAVRPTLHSYGNICNTHAVFLRRQDHLLHEIRRTRNIVQFDGINPYQPSPKMEN